MSHQLTPVVLMLVIVSSASSGCGSSTILTGPSAPPTAVVPAPVPTPGPAPGPQSTYTLSGVVFEVTPTGRAPVADVEVYCDSCGSPVGHTFAHTDAEGFYTFSWASNGTHPLLVRKAGYDAIDSTGRFADGTGVITALVNGDTRLDIQLARR